MATLSVARNELRARTSLPLESIVLCHQIAVPDCPCFRRSDRLYWIVLSRWWSDWRNSLVIVQPRYRIHISQRLLKGAAHSLQNFCSAGLSAPQAGQFISTTQLIEQCLRFLEVGGVEALGEPVVDVGEHRASLVALALLGEQPRETCRGTQLV